MIKKILEAYKNSISLDVESTIKVLQSARYRNIYDNNQYGAPHQLIEILYKTQWLLLARTDLKDDIGTLRYNWSVNEFISHIQYGARITEKYFHIIDSYSDG